MKFKLKSGVIAFVIATVALSAAMARAQTPSQSQPEPTRKGSIVNGRVIYADTRRPVRRVEVVIYDPAAKNRLRPYFTWTDGRGEFRIKDVPAGKYFVEVSAAGLIRNAIHNPEDEDEAFPSVSVDGTSSANVVVRVKRGAAVSGRVTYADGEPALQAAIKVLRKKDGKWTGVTSDVVTDDRGVYRVPGLIPGDYIVGAAEQKWGIELTVRDRPDGRNFLNRAALPATYYNGVTNLAAASPMSLQAGEEKKDIDIVLTDRAVHAVSGTVTLKGNSRAIGRARVSLKRRDEDLGFETDDLEDMVTNTDEDGRFALDEVPDGSYRLTIAPPRSFPEGESAPTSQELGARYIAKSLELSVSGADLKDLTIEVSAGSRISGKVAVAGGRPVPPKLTVYVSTKEPSGEGPSSVRIDADGTFSIEGVPPGPAYVKTSVPFEKNYYTKSVSVGNTDLFRGPLVVKEDEDVTNVRVLVSPDAAMLSGRVLAADGKTPQARIDVVLVPTDAEEQKSGYRVFGNTNADGGFSLTAAPGEYVAIAMPRGEFGYQFSSEALRVRFPAARRVVLQSGDNPRVELLSTNNK